MILQQEHCWATHRQDWQTGGRTNQLKRQMRCRQTTDLGFSEGERGEDDLVAGTSLGYTQTRQVDARRTNQLKRQLRCRQITNLGFSEERVEELVAETNRRNTHRQDRQSPDGQISYKDSCGVDKLPTWALAKERGEEMILQQEPSAGISPNLQPYHGKINNLFGKYFNIIITFCCGYPKRKNILNCLIKQRHLKQALKVTWYN